MIIQFCGLSGSGKTTLASQTKKYFNNKNIDVENIDGDEYRKVLCADLGFSKEDRNTNIRRLAFVASRLAQYRIIPIICAINPYECVRQEVTANYHDVKTIYIRCNLDELIRRDTKGLYAKALFPEGHPEKINNLSGVNDPFEIPANPDMTIETDSQTIEESTRQLINFIESHIQTVNSLR